MFRNLTFNSYIWIFLGLGCFVYGAYAGWEARRFISRAFQIPFGLIFTGLAMILTGLTNGFTDYSPWGRKFTKTGVLLFLVGLPLLIYGFWRFI